MRPRSWTTAISLFLAAAVLGALAIAPATAGAVSPVCAPGGVTPPPPPPPNCYTAFGTPGSGPGQFSDPLGVEVDDNGIVYVADSGNSRIEKIAFSSIGGVIQGSFLGTIGPSIPGGTDLSVPTGVAVDHPQTTKTGGPPNTTDDPNIYVADQNGHVQKLAPDGTFLLDFGTFGNPIGVDVDAAGHVYVTDNGTGKDIVAKFAPDGTLLNVYGKQGGGPGNLPGQFDNPQDVTVDPSGDIYVADGNNNRMQRLDPTGAFISQTTGLSDPAGIDHSLELTGPTTIVHRNWITARGSDQFFKLDSSGNIIQTEGGSGTAVGLFSSPYGLAADCDGNVFVADSGNDRIQRLGGLNLPPCVKPTNTRSPAIAGQPSVGSGLALDPGDWTGSPTPEFSYRWQRCSSHLAASCGDIAGQRGLTYTITNADGGFRIRAVVIGANDQGVIAEATDMTTQIPTTPITPLPPAPPPNPPVNLGGTPNTSPPTVTRTGLASFNVNCPVTGARTCSVLGNLVAQSKRGFVTLASVTGEVPFNHSQSFTLLLTRQGRKLLAHGLHAQAILQVSVDNQRLLTARLRVNRGTIKRIGSGG